MKRFAAGIALALGVFAATLVAAQQQTPAYDPKAAFAETDRNGDGSIEINEFFERLVDVFFLGDTNKDGFLTEDEFVRVVVIKEDFAAIDKNKDGKVDRKEFISARLPVFLEIDTDDDGALSITEVTAAFEGRSAK